MCSIFCPIMDNYQGDLTDIVRASGGGAYHGSFSSAGNSSSEAPPFSDWNFASDPMNFSSVGEESRHNFGFPFSNRQDPLLHELHIPGSSFFNSISSGGTEEAACGTTSLLGQKILEDDMRRPCNNIFSNLVQISPNAKLPISPCGSPVMTASPRAIKSSAVVSDNTGVQISSSRNPGLKRRKSQVKKVVCIPAPTAANSRPSCGEVVPSDLWAWRKYGQKPIKGSPYPRGYYRCSSSKGCSARKQVERSRTDPNMLVITYTSEHNHPWPTQRNALAGSTRSYSSKTNAVSKNPESTHPQKATRKPKDEEQLKSNMESNVLGGNSGNNAFVKEEMEEDIEKQAVVEMDDREFSDGLPYKSFQSEDFFAELEEIEADPLNLLFSDAAEVQKESMALDPSHLFEWSADTTLFEGYNKTLKKLP